MTRKTAAARAIDVAAKVAQQDLGQLRSTSASLTTVAPGLGSAPTALELVSNTIGRSAQTATARVVIAWRPPETGLANQYLVEVSSNVGFSAIVLQVTTTETRDVTIELPVGLPVWVRVYAQVGATLTTPSAAISFTTASDTSSAAQPTGLAATFIGAGDLLVTWTNPTGDNFRDVEIKIYESASKVTTYATKYDATGRFVWTAAENRTAAGGTPDTAVYVELRSRTWAGVINGASVPSATATKAVPSTPSGLTSTWASDAGTAGADITITWTAAANVEYYTLTIDGIARRVYGSSYAYTFAQNASEHAGTADPVLTLSLVAVDALDQSSAAATATATNAAPAAPASVTLVTGFSALMIAITATEPADFSTYSMRLIQTLPSASDVTWTGSDKLQTRDLSARATYQVGVRVLDRFGQQSAETLSTAGVSDGLTLADLRADITYRDSLGTAAATLDAMKDGITASGGVSYAA